MRCISTRLSSEGSLTIVRLDPKDHMVGIVSKMIDTNLAGIDSWNERYCRTEQLDYIVENAIYKLLKRFARLQCRSNQVVFRYVGRDLMQRRMKVHYKARIIIVSETITQRDSSLAAAR